jgi:hypothetical protein
LTFVPLHLSLFMANIDISINWNIKYYLWTNWEKKRRYKESKRRGNTQTFNEIALICIQYFLVPTSLTTREKQWIRKRVITSVICFDILWLSRGATYHDARLKLFCSVTPFLPYGCYLGNSWCVVPPLVEPKVSVKLNSILIKILYVAQAPENTGVWIVFQ